MGSRLSLTTGCSGEKRRLRCGIGLRKSHVIRILCFCRMCLEWTWKRKEGLVVVPPLQHPEHSKMELRRFSVVSSYAKYVQCHQAPLSIRWRGLSKTVTCF